MHIAKADGVTRLTAVEACFFSNRYSNVIAKRIYDGCADTATCGASGHDETVAVEQIQISSSSYFRRMRSASVYKL